MERSKETMALGLAELDCVAGGSSDDRLHDLSQFIYRTVCNVIHYDDTACLTLHKVPRGPIIPDVGWQNGEHILVHADHTEDGWFFAYKNGQYGYVDPNCVR